MEAPIENKVSQSGLIQLDLLEYKPKKVYEIDLAPQLWQGLAIKEKDLRDWIKDTDWSVYTEAYVCVYCSIDAIIPSWVYMLVASALKMVNASVHIGTYNDALISFWLEAVKSIDSESISGQRIVIKGCGDESIPAKIYAGFVNYHQHKIAKIMYGEPCSTVPIYKRPKAK